MTRLKRKKVRKLEGKEARRLEGWMPDAGYWIPQGLKARMLGSWEAERLGGQKAGMLEAVSLEFKIEFIPLPGFQAL